MTASKKCKLRIFTISYEVEHEGIPYKGVAVVKAGSISQATTVFKAESNFNGNQKAIKVTKVQEVYTSPQPLLLCEEYISNTVID